MMDGMKTITFNLPESLHDRLVRFVESEYQKHEGEFSRCMITEYLLCKALAVMGEHLEDFPPEQPNSLLQ